MATSIYLTNSINLTVTFRDSDGIIADPTTVVFEVFEYPLAATPVLVLTDTPTTDEEGVYSYSWTPDTVGDFLARFTGTYDDASELEFNEVIEVLAEGGTTDNVELGTDYLLEFASGFDPLYVSPEELTFMFPDSTLLEAAIALHLASLEVEEILGLSEDEVPVWIALDYVLASAACKLSNTYGDVSISNTEDSIRLGDLEVNSGSDSNFGKGNIYRHNATTPCELAAALRREMLIKATRIRAVVKGSDYPNPIPNRKFIEYRNGPPRKEIWYQGRLDDNDGTS